MQDPSMTWKTFVLLCRRVKHPWMTLLARSFPLTKPRRLSSMSGRGDRLENLSSSFRYFPNRPTKLWRGSTDAPGINPNNQCVK